MKTLAERHEDRARRIAENRSDRVGLPAVTAAAAIVAAQSLADTMASLDDDGKAEFEAAMADYDPRGSRESLAFNERGESMAGIGVVNTKVVPASAESGNGGGTAPGWTDVPETPDLGGSNINGAALEAAYSDSSTVTPARRTTRTATADKSE